MGTTITWNEAPYHWLVQHLNNLISPYPSYIIQPVLKYIIKIGRYKKDADLHSSNTHICIVRKHVKHLEIKLNNDLVIYINEWED